MNARVSSSTRSAATGDVEPGTVGAAIRHLRLERGLSLRDLGRLAGLSPSFLSLVERGHSSLGVGSLQRVAAALETNPAALVRHGSLDGTPPLSLPQVTRGGAATEVAVTTTGRTYALLSRRAPKHVLEPMLLTVEPEETMEEPSRRDGEEFLYVLSGELVYRVGAEEHRLGPGDSIHLDTRISHRVFNDKNEPAEALLVLTRRSAK